ncbi:FimV/HubP family polar landmark protein [Zobellella sp. DQSA1]|uniref:FimV/HubP family polar landmark protein n=1 Tax=Zobellella sp. DQSA1 TaxID=3342386 RepID=UPI0035C20A04
MRRLRPLLCSGLALWLACSAPSLAQGEFYIELRGPEASAPAQSPPPAASSPVNQPVPVSPPAGRYGPIRNTDTLWSIAARHTRAPVTVQQTMVALYHLNPSAFVRGNINYLQRGASLRLPTQSQARQRSPREAEAEFRRLSQQGNRSATRAATAPRQDAATRPTAASAPRPAAQPQPVSPTPAVPAQAAATTVLSEPKPASAPAPVVAAAPVTTTAAAPGETETMAAAAPGSPSPSAPDQAEELALARLQARLMDELREQVAMSNEQLAALADNNQVLRQHLSRLTAEVNELKVAREGESPAAASAPGIGRWLDELLSNPLNLALVLTLPALLLLALFTLWWRNRVKRELAEQEQELAETAMIDDERNEFDELFASDPEPVAVPPEPASDAERPAADRDIDEDAFARFLEEQQLQEEQEALRQQPSAPEVVPEPLEPGEDASQMLFDDETAGAADTRNKVSDDDIDDLLFAANPVDAGEPEDTESPKPELAEEPYVSVEQLMEEAELSEGPERDYDRKLDLELDEYADVLGQGRNIDIDLDEGGMGAKLDLARAYIEIEDIDSARDLLNEALEQGNDEQRADARKLLQRLAKR